MVRVINPLKSALGFSYEILALTEMNTGVLKVSKVRNRIQINKINQ